MTTANVGDYLRRLTRGMAAELLGASNHLATGATPAISVMGGLPRPGAEASQRSMRTWSSPRQNGAHSISSRRISAPFPTNWCHGSIPSAPAEAEEPSAGAGDCHHGVEE